MSLDDSVETPNNLKRKFFVASAYAIAAAVDTYFTIEGIETGKASEQMPHLNYLINTFGIATGLTLPKAVGITAIVKLFDYLDNKSLKNSSWTPENIVYPLTLLTAIGGTFWVWQSYVLNLIK